MAWKKGLPEVTGQYLVRFLWEDDGNVYRDVGIARFDGYWGPVSDSYGEWSDGVVHVTGWLPIPEYGED